MLNSWKKDLNFAIIIANLSGFSTKELGSNKAVPERLKQVSLNHINLRLKQAIKVPLERAEGRQIVANPLGTKRWLNQTYSSAEKGLPRC